MAEHLQVYLCESCGNIIEVLHSGSGTLVCCEKKMLLKAENTVDAAREKHIPVIESMDKGLKVKVGSAVHPMDENHYIEWIELSADGRFYRKYLKPGDSPEAEFCMRADFFSARAYCNLHGLWKTGPAKV